MNKWLFLVACCALVVNCKPIMGPDFFGNYPNYYFVETGTDGGGGVRKAIKAGFREIHSLEIDEKFVRNEKKEFEKYKHVHIWQGDSGVLLAQVIASLDKPITFWLDAHCRPELQSDHKNTPILNELEQIKNHPIKTHTILIDDMCCFGTAELDFVMVQQLINKIKEINSNYVVTFIDGTFKNDVLVAKVPKKQ